MAKSNLISPVIEIRHQFIEDFQLVGDKKHKIISFNNASLNCTLSNLPFVLCLLPGRQIGLILSQHPL